MLHEQAVGIAAEAYAQYTNGLGAALVTTGPGGTNAITAVAAAWCDSTPVVFMSGQVKTADSARERGVRQFGFQEVDIVSIVTPITKYAALAESPAHAVEVINEAIRIATSDRPGPVWVDIPLDIQAAELPESMEDDDECAASPQAALVAQPEQIATVRDALLTAERPIVLLGNGVRLADAAEDATALFRRLQVPMALTWKAMDCLDYNDPLNAGRPGSIATYSSNFALQSADFILAIGARLDLGQLGYRHDSFGPRARLVVVDVDQNELAKFNFSSPYLGIRADAGDFVRQLSDSLDSQGALLTDPWLERIHEWQDTLPRLGEDDSGWTDGLSQYSLIEELSRQMTPEHLLVPGSSGACSEVVMQAFRNKAGQRVFNTEGLGPMGFGIPAAIGASVASGGRPVVSVDGDGGFAMNVQELATVAFHNLPISFFILDNQGYGSIRSTADNYFSGRRVGCDAESGLGVPDYANVAASFGVVTFVASDRDTLTSAVSAALSANGPSLTVVRIGRESRTTPRLSTQRTADGQMITAPLHLLSPVPDGVEPELEIQRRL
jgi:acetolactate synthase-1/2/3 large subunit